MNSFHNNNNVDEMHFDELNPVEMIFYSFFREPKKNDFKTEETKQQPKVGFVKKLFSGV